MKEMSISQPELERLAGEILEKLKEAPEREAAVFDGDDGYSRAGRTERSDAWTESIRRAAAQESAAVQKAARSRGAGGSAVYGEAQAESAEHLPVLSRQEVRETGLLSQRRAPRRTGGREESGAERTTAAGGAFNVNAERMTAERLSEAFCRDARRYDGGFEKY